jgi:hypothetical protein
MDNKFRVSEEEIDDMIRTWAVHHEQKENDTFSVPRIIDRKYSTYIYQNIINNKDKFNKRLPEWFDNVPIVTDYSGDTKDSYDASDSFKPVYNNRACAKLTVMKNKVCKLNVEKCSADMKDEELRDRYENFLHCGNLRAIENNSHCYNKDGLFDPNEKQHMIEVNKQVDSAKNCIKAYQVKRSRSRTSKGQKKFKGSRSRLRNKKGRCMIRKNNRKLP